jgi:hypothetical protein
MVRPNEDIASADQRLARFLEQVFPQISEFVPG